jgi:DNA-binding NtrC family response regulator
MDEVGDLPLETQAKLLRVLQERHFQRVGGDEVIQVDVRVLAATHRNLETALQEGEFREDLFYRLSVVTIEVPPLSDRVEDIPDLVRFFLRKYGEESGVSSPSIQPEAITFLQEQPWPGNVRELENTVREALLLGRPFGVNRDNVEQVIARKQQRTQAAHQTHSTYITTLLQRAQQGLEQDVFSRLIADLEPELYTQAIRMAQGNQAKAARWLGVTRLKMREKLTQLGLHPGREAGG